MDYIKVAYPKPENTVQSEILIAQLAEIGFESFEETDQELLAYIPSKDFDPQRLPEYDPKPKVELIPDQNWNAVWESNYQPVLIAEKVFIRAPFHQANQEADFDLVIHPKMAFGTAHHETTALMIEYLLDLKNLLKGASVLDMGCGTGVLAILSAKLEAQNVTAIDNDTWSVESANENKMLNETSSVNVLLGDAATLPQKETFDLILANINKNILLRDMPNYTQALKKGGSIVFSGFYQNDLQDLVQKAQTLDLKLVSHKIKNDWTAAHFIKSLE